MASAGPVARSSSGACGLPGGRPGVGRTGGTAGAGFVVAADRTPGIRYIVAAPCRYRAKLGRAAGSGATGAPITCIGPVRGGKGSGQGCGVPARAESGGRSRSREVALSPRAVGVV